MNPLEARRRLLGRNVYKRTTEGNPAIAQGSLARMYPGITMQGWTEQDSTEGKNLFDKSEIVLSSTTITYMPVNVGDGEYTLSTNYIAPGRNDVFFLPGNVNTGASSLSNGVQQGTSRTVTSENGYVTVALRLSSDGTTSPLDYQIMLNEGSTAIQYEPYTGGQPSPNPDYPQEITSAGKYDEGTGKWEYEITIENEQTDPDKNQTVTLTSDRPLTKWDRLEKRNGQWGWAYKSAEIVLDGSEEWGPYPSFVGYYSPYMLPFSTTRREGYSDRGYVGYYYDRFSIWIGVNNPNIYVCFAPTYNEELEDRGIDNWKNFLSENPITIITYLDEETFAPLTTAEQEAMNALHTFRPTTVLSNDCDCNMILTYKTKKSLEGTD